MDSQYFSCHSRDNRIAVSPNQKPEYHHDRHLVLFALLDWFLIPDPLRAVHLTSEIFHIDQYYFISA